MRTFTVNNSSNWHIQLPEPGIQWAPKHTVECIDKWYIAMHALFLPGIRLLYTQDKMKTAESHIYIFTIYIYIPLFKWLNISPGIYMHEAEDIFKWFYMSKTRGEIIHELQNSRSSLKDANSCPGGSSQPLC